MSTHSNHPYHLVDYIPWLLTGAIGTVTGMAKWFHEYDISSFILGNNTMLTVHQWWRHISREGIFQGKE